MTTAGDGSIVNALVQMIFKTIKLAIFNKHSYIWYTIYELGYLMSNLILDLQSMI